MHIPSYAGLVALASVLLPYVVEGVPAARFPRRDIPSTPEIVQDSYIIVFKKGVNASEIADHEAGLSGLVKRHGSHHKGINHNYNFKGYGFKGYHVETDSDTIAQIAASPLVSICMDGRSARIGEMANNCRLRTLSRTQSCT